MTQPSNSHISDADLELLSAYIDNQLAGEERGALVERLRQEPALRAALDELRATVGLLRELEPQVPPRSFTLDPQAYQPRRSALFDRLNIGSALAALALTFLCVAVFVLRGALPGIRTGGNVASAPPAAPASGGSQALTLATASSAAAAAEATAAGPPFAAGEATAAPLAAQAPAAAEAPAATAAPPEAAAGVAAEATTGPSDATSARETDNPPEAANGAAAPTGQPALDQQVAATAEAPVQPPIATSGSTAPGTGYLPPQQPAGAAGQEPPSPLALLRGPILVLSGLLLLLIIGLLWIRRRR